jgi:hypothetical protein
MLDKLSNLRKTTKYFSLPLIFITSFLLVSCSKSPESDQSTQESAQEQPAEKPQNVKSYDKNGLTISYPANWEFLYDEEPDMYASRGVGFQVSEFSNVRVLIDPNQSLKLTALADRFEKELQLKSNQIAGDYARKPTTLGKHKGEKLSWVDKSAGSIKFEVTIITVAEAPATIFVVSHLSETDIANETKYIDYFVKNISYKHTGVATNTDK